MAKRFFIAAAFLALAGCAAGPQPTVPVGEREDAWEAHSRSVAGLDRWRLTGRVAIVSGPEAWHVTADWRQQEQFYDIRLIAPLGQGSVRLEGGARRVTLYDGEGGVIVADEPGSLLHREMGWRLPIGALRYWVVGLPAPGEVEARRLDAEGRLAELRQAGWHIEFSDYTRQEGVVLPGRVFATYSSEDARVRLRIGRWRLPRKAVERGDGGLG